MATKSKRTLTAPPIKPRDEGWGAGLHFCGKCLNVKSVRRATTPQDVLVVVLAHNLRQNNAAHRHRKPIAGAMSPLNEVLLGPTDADVAADVAHNALDECGIQSRRRDTIVAIELVIQPPDGADGPAFWDACLEWAGRRYQCLLTAVVHRDQRRPHMHLVALAVTDGRLCGDAMSSGANRFVTQRREFMAHMRLTLGLRPDRKVRTLADLALSPGRGPKSKTQADRSDAALVRKVEAERRRANLGMGVDGRGGSALETGNPLAQAKEPTPLLRSVSHVATLWAELFDHRQQVPQNEAMTASTAMARGVVFEREREDAFSASSWSTELGEFVASSQAMPAIRAARTSADAWVAGELRTRGLAARHAQPATAATCGANSSPGGQPMTTETMAGNTTDATEPAPIPTTPKGRDLRMPSKTDKSADRLAAEVVVSGLAGNARTTVSFGEATFGELSLTECASVLNGTAKALNDGDLGSAVTMLAAQAVALNAMFGELARVGQANMFKTVDYADRYLRLAFKAQSQCRATLETLAAIKNPPVMFARQANINNGGHQQVNNGQAPTAERYAQGCASAHPGEFTSRPNELLEDRRDGSTQLDSRATAAASSKNQGVESVGALNWPAQR